MCDELGLAVPKVLALIGLLENPKPDLVPL
jgi:hypothetical protein